VKTLVSATKAQQVLFWLMGFLDVPSPLGLAFVAAYVTIGCAFLLLDAPRLNLLALATSPRSTSESTCARSSAARSSCARSWLAPS